MTTKQDLVSVRNSLVRSNNILTTLERLDNESIRELGEKAMGLITDYPLYLSGESNISYAEAIGIAMFVFGDIEQTIERNKEIEKAIPLYDKYRQEFDLAQGNPVCFEEWFENDYQELKKGN